MEVFLSSSEIVLIAAVFIVSAVEMVEALTIVLAVGVTRGWRSSLEGVVAAILVLSAIVVALGPALVRYVPIDLLRALVGGVLLIFGLQWMRKAVLRASGLKEKRNEDAIYGKTVAELSTGKASRGRDAQGFAVAFKGVFIEGLEVVIIVLTLGSSAHNFSLAIISALGAAVVVALVGLAVSKQLSGVPENAMKLVVGIMLVSFGTFWGGEGLGLSWPGNDLMIPMLVCIYGAITYLMVKVLTTLGQRRQELAAKIGNKVELSSEVVPSGVIVPDHGFALKLFVGFLRFWWDFLVGETPEVFVGTVVIFVITELLLRYDFPSLSEVVLGPLLVMVLLNTTVARAYRQEL